MRPCVEETGMKGLRTTKPNHAAQNAAKDQKTRRTRVKDGGRSETLWKAKLMKRLTTLASGMNVNERVNARS